MRNAVRARGMDRPRGPRRFNLARFNLTYFNLTHFNRFNLTRFNLARFTPNRSDLRRLAMPSGTAVSTQKHIEIIFEGAESSCYPWFSLGVEGIVSSTSHSPN